MNLYPSRVKLDLTGKVLIAIAGHFYGTACLRTLDDLNGKSTDFKITIKQSSTRQPCKSVFLLLRVLLC